MPTKDKATASAQAEQAALDATAAYEAALAHFAKGVEALRSRDYQAASERFEQARAGATNEPELADRARTYLQICARAQEPGQGNPVDGDDRFRRAVFLLNSGELDESLALLNQALLENPTSVDVLYVRACVWAQKRAAEKSVGDLRQAIAADPKVRFQAINDPDFEPIREEPAFIDIIEPTPPGA